MLLHTLLVLLCGIAHVWTIFLVCTCWPKQTSSWMCIDTALVRWGEIVPHVGRSWWSIVVTAGEFLIVFDGWRRVTTPCDCWSIPVRGNVTDVGTVVVELVVACLCSVFHKPVVDLHSFLVASCPYSVMSCLHCTRQVSKQWLLSRCWYCNLWSKFLCVCVCVLSVCSSPVMSLDVWILMESWYRLPIFVDCVWCWSVLLGRLCVSLSHAASLHVVVCF